MAETDILNPAPGYDPEVGDTMNPDYGFSRKRTNTRSVKKPVGGVPFTRETQNTGHSFNLTWTGRSQACVDRIKWYAEQYEDGFFTFIDWEDRDDQGDGRHYVGRFTSEITPTPTANHKWNITGAVFEEVPTSNMMQYPGYWDRDSVDHFVCNDFGDVKVASYLAASGLTWAQTPHPELRGDAGAASPALSLDTAGAAGDWAQYEYRGYGFRLYLLTGPDAGRCTISLDGVVLQNPQPISHGDHLSFDLYSPNPLGIAMVLPYPQVPLDFHRVMVTATGAANLASTGTAVRWWKLEVMR